MSRFFWSKTMKQLLICGCAALLGLLPARAVDPIFCNDNSITSPPDNAPVIDAYAWCNRAPFNITTPTGLPFESQHTLHFTNTSTMFCTPGFRFFNNVGGQRLWMDSWTNFGTIATDSSQSFLGVVGNNNVIVLVGNSQASMLMVKSTNIASTGTGSLRSGAQGLV